MAASDSTPGKAPAFQFYPNDFLSDANVIVMSLQERGAYITLICVCWQQGTLPNNIEQLARFCGTPAATFRKLWPAVERCFKVSANGLYLLHPRLEKERKKQREYRKLQSDKGKASAARRNHGSTAVQPRLDSGSTEGQPAIRTPVQPEPNSSSSVFDLQSSTSDSGQKSERALRGVGGGVMAGTLPRDHLQCRQPCIRVCVSQKQHAILRERHGGTDADLDAFYADVRERLQGPVGDTPWMFWQAQFTARFGSATAVNPKTAGNAAAAARFVARGQQ